MRLFESRVAGDRVAHGEHRGVAFEVLVGNDVQDTTMLGTTRTYKSLITRSEIDGKPQFACHVIVTPWYRKSRITGKRIKEAYDSWKEAIDDLLDNK